MVITLVVEAGVNVPEPAVASTFPVAGSRATNPTWLPSTDRLNAERTAACTLAASTGPASALEGATANVPTVTPRASGGVTYSAPHGPSQIKRLSWPSR